MTAATLASPSMASAAFPPIAAATDERAGRGADTGRVVL